MIIGKCLVCHSKLEHSHEPIQVSCYKCGKEEQTYIICENNHYFCNSCASKQAIECIYPMISMIEHTNPLDVAEKLMVNCGITGNSPHPLTTASYLIAYKNLTGRITEEDIIEGIERATQIPGGWCGYYGNCGAAVGLGVAFSIITQSTPLCDEERSVSNIATAEGLFSVADQGGPRCCTASVRRVLEKSIQVSEKYLEVIFPIKEKQFKRCWQSKFNAECKKESCKYYSITEEKKEIAYDKICT